MAVARLLEVRPDRTAAAVAHQEDQRSEPAPQLGHDPARDAPSTKPTSPTWKQFRVDSNAALAKQKSAVKLTMLAFVIKASVAALKKFPQFNASLSEDGART
jgi:hypothetical protein